VIGEICVQGPSVALGYWKKKEVNKAIFESPVLDQNGAALTDEGAFLRTGDLGFVDDDMLYVTGRLKELIIINGANIYPQDIEKTVQESSEVLQENAGAVFSVESEEGLDKIIVFQEIARQHVRDFSPEELFDLIGKQIIANHEVPVGGIYLISPGQIPKTTSGKIQRVKCKKAYTDGDIPAVLASSETKEELPAAEKPKDSLPST
jgi:acyl-CoA synthetase (AMP-forming)/AMP-acid ligase II